MWIDQSTIESYSNLFDHTVWKVVDQKEIIRCFDRFTISLGEFEFYGKVTPGEIHKFLHGWKIKLNRSDTFAHWAKCGNSTIIDTDVCSGNFENVQNGVDPLSGVRVGFVVVGVHRVLRRRFGASLLLYGLKGLYDLWGLKPVRSRGLYSPLSPVMVPPMRLRRTEMTPPPRCP